MYEIIIDEEMARAEIDNLLTEGHRLAGSYILGVGTLESVKKSVTSAKKPLGAVAGPLVLSGRYYPTGVGFYKKSELQIE